MTTMVPVGMAMKIDVPISSRDAVATCQFDCFMPQGSDINTRSILTNAKWQF